MLQIERTFPNIKLSIWGEQVYHVQLLASCEDDQGCIWMGDGHVGDHAALREAAKELREIADFLDSITIRGII